MRWFLVLALVLHFTGVPVAGGMVCRAAAAGGHSCCEAEPSVAVSDRVTGHCGCAMMPNAPTEQRRALGVSPEPREGDAPPPVQHTLALDARAGSDRPPAHDGGPPSPGASFSFLSGGGFRC